MLRSLYNGASGVKVHQTKMDVIGNNISNVNTTGFKAGRATFSDMLSQNIGAAAPASGNVGSTNDKQIGLGSNVGAIDVLHNNGSILETGKNTDVALSGDGMFVVRRGNDLYYTRDGAFEFDAAGNYGLPGSGYLAQGWTATDGVINNTGAIGDINVAIGQEMAAKGTDTVNYYYNLDADVPVVVGIEGGEAVTRTILAEDVSEADPLPVTFGGKNFLVSWISDNMDMSDNWSINEDIALGATTVELINDKGETVTAKITPEAVFEVAKGTPFGTVDVITKGSVTEQYPMLLTIDGKQYTATAMDKNLNLTKNWTVKSGGATEGSNTITLTDGESDMTFTLNSPLTETLGQSAAKIELVSALATEQNPVKVTFSDGTVAEYTDGTYHIGNSAPVQTVITVYDSLGDTHQIPVYFIREGEYTDGVENSTNKWLVSLTPDASVLKGDVITSEFTDAKGNTGTVSFTVSEIQFDSSGKLLTEGESDFTGTMTLNFDPASFVTETPVDGATDALAPVVQTSQVVTFDYSDLTQYAGESSVMTVGNGNLAGTLSRIDIDSTGTIIGTYTNGVSQPEAQIALAHFNNMPGLTKTGESMYQASDNSGVPVIINVGEFGTVITPNALEMSNVDVATEFAEMIITQRGFQSNTKVITVSDQMLETAINLRR